MPNGILARVHEQRLELHKLEIRMDEERKTSMSTAASCVTPIAITKIQLPTKGWCISLSECDPDNNDNGIIIAVGSSCGVLLYCLQPQQCGNEWQLQNCNVVKTVQGTLFSPHVTVAVVCGGE